jgi:hypothetical protein
MLTIGGVPSSGDESIRSNINTERINDPVPSSLDLLDESNIPQEHSDDNSEDENDTSLIAEEALQEDFENVKKEEEVKELLKE